MKVKEVMTTSAVACSPTNSLADAAGLMWNNDCGILPVITESGQVVGLVTDRDICMSALLTGRGLSDIPVDNVISGKVLGCKAEDEIHFALKMMRDNKVRRLPVLAADGTLDGMLSLNDLVLRAADGTAKATSELTYGDVIKAYKAICEHHVPMIKAHATTGA